MRAILIALLAFTSIALGQRTLKGIQEASIPLLTVQVGYAHQWPGGDLASRFMDNSNIGLGAWRKGEQQWLFGVEGSFIFGSKVIEPGILRNVVNSLFFPDRSGGSFDVVLPSSIRRPPHHLGTRPTADSRRCITVYCKGAPLRRAPPRSRRACPGKLQKNQALAARSWADGL